MQKQIFSNCLACLLLSSLSSTFNFNNVVNEEERRYNDLHWNEDNLLMSADDSQLQVCVERKTLQLQSKVLKKIS